MLETDPAQRPGSMAEVARQLAGAAGAQAAGGARAAPTPAGAAKAKSEPDAAQGETQGSLKGSSAVQARKMIAEQEAEGKVLDTDRLVSDEEYRNRMVQRAMSACGLAKTSLEKAGYPEAAKKIENTQLGLLMLMSGWPQLVRTNQGLALTQLQLTMFGYYFAVVSVVNIIGLGKRAEGDEDVDLGELVNNIIGLTDNMMPIMEQIKKTQKPQKQGFFKKLFK